MIPTASVSEGGIILDLKQLSYFVTIVQEGTISAAAKKLYLSQPPLSYQMKLLEAELQCTLFERGARNIQLTDEGKLLYQRATALLEMSEVAKEEILSYSLSDRGTIRIGMVSSVISAYGTRWICDFSRQYPRIRFEIYEADTYALLNKLKENIIHLAILRSPYNEQDYTRIVLASEPMIAIGSKKYLSEGLPHISMEAVSALPLITYRRWEPLISDAFRSRELPADYICICDDARTVASFTEHDLGVGIGPRSTAQFIHQKEISCLPITDLQITSDIELIYNPNAYLPQCSRLFVEFMQQSVSGQKPDDALHQP